MADNFVATDVDDSVDEGFAEEMTSDSESITASMLLPGDLWGCTYHALHAEINDYWGPDDELQQEVLEWGHAMLKLLLKEKLFLAPMDTKRIHDVLDVGCGTGAWVFNFAEAHAHARVEGIDLSPVRENLIPPNCWFYVEDLEERWNTQPGRFDFVYIRCLMGAIRDWPALYRQAFHEIRPGGYIEQLEMSIDFASGDGSVLPDHDLAGFDRTIVDCGERVGKTSRVAEKAKGWIRAAGVEDVHEQWYTLPVGAWSGNEELRKIGSHNYHYWDSGAEGLALFLLIRVLRWSYDESQIYIARFRNALKDRSNQVHHHVIVVWGRKPMK